MAHDIASKPSFRLPTLLTGPIELRQTWRELDALDEFMRQAGLRKGGDPVKLPKTSLLLDALATTNQINLLVRTQRRTLLNYVTIVDSHAPRLHVSFSSDPSPAFLAKIVDWLRENISPYALVQVGLQPGIGAGCVLRTANKQFDFSLGQYLHEHRDELEKALDKVMLNEPVGSP